MAIRFDQPIPVRPATQSSGAGLFMQPLTMIYPWLYDDQRGIIHVQLPFAP